jgi:hypothetical protein
MARNVKRLVIAPSREHGRKPDQISSRIERLARGPYLELFARQSRRGWDRWGDQALPFDAGHVRTRNRLSNMCYNGNGHGHLRAPYTDTSLIERCPNEIHRRSRDCFRFPAVPLAGIVEPVRSQSHITPFPDELLADVGCTQRMT